MARVSSRQAQAYLYLWERQLLDRIRQMRKAQGNFMVLLHFMDDRIMLHMVEEEKIVLSKD